MTVREYVSSLLSGLNFSEAHLISAGLDPNSDVDLSDEGLKDSILLAMSFAIMTPYQKSVSESGFSVSWDTSKIGQFYVWLCKKWGRKPDEDTLSTLGISTIIDRTDEW